MGFNKINFQHFFLILAFGRPDRSLPQAAPQVHLHLGFFLLELELQVMTEHWETPAIP